MKILTKSAYARLRGVQGSAISNWIARGKLAPPAVTPDGRIVVEEADSQLGGPASVLEPAAGAPLPDGALSDRARKNRAAAEIAELELAEKRRRANVQAGRYLLTDQVRADRGRDLQRFIAALDNWVAMLAGELALDTQRAAGLRASWRRFRERFAAELVAEAEKLPTLLPEPDIEVTSSFTRNS